MYVRPEHDIGIEDGSIWDQIPNESDGLSNRIPRWNVGIDLYSKIKTFDNNPSGSVTAALLKLEDIVRRLSEAPKGAVGVKLMGDAFGRTGKLRFKRDVDTEADGWASLYSGIYSAIRNPLSHNDIDLDKAEAVRYILLCDMLIKKLRKETNEAKPKPRKGSIDALYE